MKLTATRHHALAAHLHRHIHLSGKFLCNPRWLDPNKYGEPCYERGGMTMEEQEKFIQPLLSEFEMPAPQAPAAA